jgi:hypothetical protein
MRKVADFSAFFFIVSVVILSIVSILGVWNIFGEDVISKSFQTLGLLAGVSLVVIVASRFMNNHHVTSDGMGAPTEIGASIPPPANIVQLFSSIRHMTIVLLIMSVVFMTLFGVLSIWEVFSKEVMTKSISSISILGFMSFIIVMTCLEREDHKLIKNKMNDQSVAGVVIIFVFLGWWFFSSLF